MKINETPFNRYGVPFRVSQFRPVLEAFCVLPDDGGRLPVGVTDFLAIGSSDRFVLTGSPRFAGQTGNEKGATRACVNNLGHTPLPVQALLCVDCHARIYLNVQE